VTLLTVSEVQESDRDGRHTETYRGQDRAIAVIAEAARTADHGAGTIFISALEDAVTVSTGRHAANIG
jgi:nitrogen regulatory protein PII